jgi:diadenosine tetraphosphate (Ap4A) HIT family hydrolase
VPAVCPFCDESQRKNAVRETEHAYVMPNRVSYDHWESRDVIDHLMVIPKQHVKSFAELSDAAKIEIMSLIGEYEAGDYNVYARARTSPTRSVAHQHTHLIRTAVRPGRLMLYLRRPYFLFKF